MLLDGCITFCLPIYRHLVCFHLLAIVNYATVSMGIQITISIPAFNSFGYTPRRASQGVLVVKSPPASAGEIETPVSSLGQEDSLEENMATHSSILAWRIPWTEEPGRLQSMGLHRVKHN